MTATKVVHLRQLVRMTLGDDSVLGSYLYTNDQVDQAISAVFALGLGPEDYSVDETGLFTPALESGDDLALVVFHAARLRVGGDDGAMSYQTRALKVTDRGERKSSLLKELEHYIHRIEGGQCCFGQQRDFLKWANDLSGGLLEKQLRYDGNLPLIELCCC